MLHHIYAVPAFSVPSACSARPSFLRASPKPFIICINPAPFRSRLAKTNASVTATISSASFRWGCVIICAFSPTRSMTMHSMTMPVIINACAVTNFFESAVTLARLSMHKMLLRSLAVSAITKMTIRPGMSRPGWVIANPVATVHAHIAILMIAFIKMQ